MVERGGVPELLQDKVPKIVFCVLGDFHSTLKNGDEAREMTLRLCY